MLELDSITCGDCLELMKGIEDNSVDLVVTDPPYGIKRDKGFEGFEGFGGFGEPIARRQYKDDWDQERPEKQYFDEILRVSKNAIIFGGNHFADILPLGNHWIVWDKLNTMPTFGDCELIWTNIDRKSVKKIRHEYNGLLGKEDQRYHPTQKPVGLLEKLLYQYSKEGDIILDPFLGSGTTAVACVNLNRHYLGIELDEGYVAIANKRVEEAKMIKYSQPELF